ncbi:MAG: metallophosphoesterase family protein [Pyrinomonadaceae bacterium]
MTDLINNNSNNDSKTHGDGIDRRGFLNCMAWAGTGLLWTMGAGALSACKLEGTGVGKGSFSFVQLSDSHIGFNKEPNTNVTTTFQEAITRINALPEKPAFLIHTGDLTHLSKPGEFDTVAEVLKSAKTNQVFYVPGEHDVFVDQGKQYLERYGKGTKGNGWQSFDYQGVHFIGLNNVVSSGAGANPGSVVAGGSEGLGLLGQEQLDWLKKDLSGRSNSTPIVVFAHVPLWTVYPQWGWGTQDGEQALSYLKGFGSVTVLNGHIHQIMQKVEGNVTFHTARSTAFPQPTPGSAPSPGPIKDVPAEKLRSMLGLTNVNYVEKDSSLAVVDSTLV